MTTRTPRLTKISTDLAEGFGSVIFTYSDGSTGAIYYLPYESDPSDEYLPKAVVAELIEHIATVARLAAGL